MSYVLRNKLVIFVLALAAPVMAWSAPKEAGKILLIKGDVRIDDKSGNIVASTKASANRRLLQAGSPFFVGEIIKTQSDARVKLEFNQGGVDGNNSVVLGANTSLAIEDVSAAGGKKNTSLMLYQGTVRNDVKAKYQGKDGDQYQVKTANAVAGVRGTIFLAEVSRTGETLIACSEGAVRVSSIVAGAVGPAAEVRMGNLATIGAKGAPVVEVINAAASAKLESLGGDGESKERVPAEGATNEDKKDAGQPAAGKGSGKESADNGDAKPDAPLNREKENKGGRDVASGGDGSGPGKPGVIGIGDPRRTPPPPPGMPIGPPPINQLLNPIGNAQTTLPSGNGAAAARGSVCIKLNGPGC